MDNSVSPDDYFDYRICFESRTGFPKVDRELDIVILNQTPPLLTYEILKKGKLVSCQDKRKLVFFIARAIKRYLDTEHLRSVQFGALDKRIKKGSFGHLRGSHLFSVEKIRDLSAKIASNRKDEEK